MRVLLVEDSAADARLVLEMTREDPASSVELVHATRLTDALRRLSFETFDAALLDLSLPDARGLEVVKRVQETATDLPIVVFSGQQDEAQALESVRSGAQDYLLKGRTDAMLLTRALRYAIERKRAELQIQHLAYHDGLTGLPNRRLFFDRLHQGLARTRRQKNLLALLFLDLDNFKVINDSLGHLAGDQLLQEVASRLSSHLRDSDTVARLGGDEFAIIMPEMANVEDVIRVATKVQWALEPPLYLYGQSHHLTASIGISLYPNDGGTPEALLRCADAAMFQAKRRGRHVYHLYSAALGHESSDRLSLCNGLRRALDADQFLLHYQPRVDARTGRILGVEALLRWRHPTCGLLPPSRFVPLAEEMGLIVPIGQWVLNTACTQAELWNRSAAGRHLRMSVNLSGREFGNKNLGKTVETTLKSTGFPPSRLELELPERGLMGDEQRTASSLRELSSLGVRLSVDDFGIGQSSLRLLKQLPIDALKIDQSFVRDVATDPYNTAIVRGIIGIAHGMGATAVAEGVETPEQAARLMGQDCDELQGFYFGMPQPAQALTALLEEAAD